MASLFYRINGIAESLEIPTIQIIEIPDNSTIPSRPTITGEYRNQFVTKGARKVSFTAFLEDGEYNGEFLDVKYVIDKLDYLYKNKIKFNLTTSVEAEAKFLTDLAIENINYDRSADRRNRIEARINCVQLQLVDLGWKESTEVDIFGENIIPKTSTETAIEEVATDFQLSPAINDFQLEVDWTDKINHVCDHLSGKKDSVVMQIREQIEYQIKLSKDELYFRLGESIDLSKGTRIHHCKAACESTYGSDEPYRVEILKADVTVTKNESSLVPNIPLGYISPKITMKMKTQSAKAIREAAASMLKANEIHTHSNTIRYVYDFADTYRNFDIDRSLENIETNEGLTEYLEREYEIAGFSEDINAVKNHIIVKNFDVYTYQIKQRYAYSVTVCGKTFKFIPTGGLDVNVLGTFNTRKDRFKPVISDTKYQAQWDSRFKMNYEVTVVAVTLGTILQLYVFSPVLNTTMI